MNSTMTNDQTISQTFKDFLGIKPKGTYFFINGWVKINDDDINTALANHSGLDAASLRRVFIDFIVEKISDCSYGAGLDYELYESRRQESIETVLELLIAKRLEDSEIAYFKRRSDYEEEFTDEAGCCEDMWENSYCL